MSDDASNSNATMRGRSSRARRRASDAPVCHVCNHGLSNFCARVLYPRQPLLLAAVTNCDVTIYELPRNPGSHNPDLRHARAVVRRERISANRRFSRAKRGGRARRVLSDAFPHRLLTARSRANRASSDSPIRGDFPLAFTIAIYARRDSRVHRITCIIIGDGNHERKARPGRRRCSGGISGM